MTTPLQIALISGGISSERDVSLAGGDQVYAALDKTKYTVTRYDPKTDLSALVTDAGTIDAALIILHGRYGEDGTVQGLLDLLQIPYQGTGVLGSALAMNKLSTKQMYEKTGIPVPGYMMVYQGGAIDAEAIVAEMGLPLVVKPAEGGSSIGMSIVHKAEELVPAIQKAFTHDGAIMVETYIQGIELTVGVIGNQELEALPVIEIIPDQNHDFFDYQAKYTPGLTNEICPARISDADTQSAQDYALKAHRALFCRGYSRTDMILAPNGIFVLETNTIPGMTQTSLLPLAAKTAGISYAGLLDRLIGLSLEGRHTG